MLKFSFPGPGFGSSINRLLRQRQRPCKRSVPDDETEADVSVRESRGIQHELPHSFPFVKSKSKVKKSRVLENISKPDIVSDYDSKMNLNSRYS